MDAVRGLYELVGEDRELFDELVTEFQEQGPRRITELGRAIATGDSALASRASVLGPEAVMTRHLAGLASRSAFVLPTDRDAAPARP